MVGGLTAIRALREGFGVRLLARPKHGVSAQERVRRLFSVFGVSSSEWDAMKGSVEIFIGDVEKPGLGLDRQRLGRLAEGLSSIIHAAANTSFDESRAAASAAVNIDGARNVSRLAESCGARLVHISTAYVAGDSPGKVFEKEHSGEFPWKNVYEKTKFVAEREVHRFCQSKGLDYCVFRPAVLIGDSVRGRTVRFNNLYNFIRVAYSLSLRRKGARAVVEADPEARLNLVPVDFAVDAMWRISRSPSSHKIFHIANPCPPRLQDLVNVYGKILNIHAECVDPRTGEKRSGDDGAKRIGAAFSEYNRYMFGEPEFDMANTRAAIPDYDQRFPAMDETYFRKILDYAVEQRWGKNPKTAPPKSFVKEADNFADLYFEQFLKGKLHRRLLPNLKSLDAVVSIRIRDEKNAAWVLELKRGRLTAISRNGLAPECGYETDLATFKAVAGGKIPPQNAFFEGKGEITGDIEKGLKVITALSEFFVRYPFDPESFRK